MYTYFIIFIILYKLKGYRFLIKKSLLEKRMAKRLTGYVEDSASSRHELFHERGRSVGEKQQKNTDSFSRVIKVRSKANAGNDQNNKQQHYLCSVCNEHCRIRQIKVFGDCGHKYCQTCLHQHITNTIKSFRTVRCLEEDCHQFLDISSPHIRALKLPLQQKYYKIRIALNSQKDQDIRMCPTQNCEGFIKLSDEKPECPICHVQTCRKCFFPKHSGNCDDNGVSFLKNKFLFQKCSKCMIVLEKNKGCNHMTCKCGYQFCYLCGEKWSSSHICKPSISPSVPVPVRAPVLAPVRAPRASVPIVPPVRQPNPVPVPAPAPVPISIPIPVPAPVPISISIPLPAPVPVPVPALVPAPIQAPVVAPLRVPVEARVLRPVAVPRTDCEHFRLILFALFKVLIFAISIVLVDVLTLQFIYPIFMCIIIPITVSVYYFLKSIVLGIKQITTNESRLRICLLNIFLLFYYALPIYYNKIRQFFIDNYCNSSYLAINCLFPISYVMFNELMECMF